MAPRLEQLLYLWASWMRNDGTHTLDLPSRSPIIGISHGADFDQIYDQVTAQTAQAVDGCIQSLQPVQQQALRVVYLDEDWPRCVAVRPGLDCVCDALQIIINRRGIA